MPMNGEVTRGQRELGEEDDGDLVAGHARAAAGHRDKESALQVPLRNDILDGPWQVSDGGGRTAGRVAWEEAEPTGDAERRGAEDPEPTGDTDRE